MFRVLLVDDHKVVRAGLRALLEASGRVEVVGEASSGEEGIEKARTLEPDVVIMDLAMPGIDGVQATRRIAALGIETKVLVLTIHDEDEFLLPALDAGADGFLNKSVADTELLGAIEALLRGHSYLPRRAAALLRRKRSAQASSDPGAEVLSPRERTVVKLYAQGFTASEMAREVFLSPKTVEGYLARAKKKLGLKNRREIVRFALEAGLLSAEEEG
ncbi:MAG: response regulator transcription factor [Gemmatimonadetes bacterium]|nr:response regulator transcription factor [Gammaproteobacteria bacterium]MYE94863.1 response regulator transcription factor [Gemmatimonadota bacterium]MYJ09857.1 response regulator transcription factor [Gemmatimonadota bacterium]